jgi:hypothetical protein
MGSLLACILAYASALDIPPSILNLLRLVFSHSMLGTNLVLVLLLYVDKARRDGQMGWETKPMMDLIRIGRQHVGSSLMKLGAG